ncbi:hypothetical protein EJ02DRAFT_454139 [Clathrospora elynae]|uniref:Secreted protein n=1 Tax=Clathrospora elynae TaxID=706981 RepID=A0A6A5SPV2_9PLEO|nr:hypothetical protein EJ02DRAFT_454139 [Clathrospora elynae]
MAQGKRRTLVVHVAILSAQVQCISTDCRGSGTVGVIETAFLSTRTNSATLHYTTQGCARSAKSRPLTRCHDCALQPCA